MIPDTQFSFLKIHVNNPPVLTKKSPGKFWNTGDFRKYFSFYYLNEIPKPTDKTLYWAHV